MVGVEPEATIRRNTTRVRALAYRDGRALERPDLIICRTGAETNYFTLAVLRYFERQDLRPNIKRDPVTWRPNAKAPAKKSKN